MSEDQTRRLIGKLADDLSPVRRAPSLRSLASRVLAVSGVVLAYSIARNGVRSDWGALVTGDATYAAVLFALVVCGIGATLSALAGAAPGREAVVQRGEIAAALGIVAVLLAGALSALSGASFSGSLGTDWMCLRAAFYLSPLPVAAVLWAASRGWVGSPWVTAIAALVGAAAAGALGVHLACPLLGARHFLLGHAAAPLLLALAASLPAAELLRRVAR